MPTKDFDPGILLLISETVPRRVPIVAEKEITVVEVEKGVITLNIKLKISDCVVGPEGIKGYDEADFKARRVYLPFKKAMHTELTLQNVTIDVKQAKALKIDGIDVVSITFETIIPGGKVGGAGS
jgi:hypothetical protein